MVVRHYNWRKVALISSTDEPWLPAALGFTKQLEAAKIEVLMPAAFEPGSFKADTLKKVRDSIE